MSKIPSFVLLIISGFLMNIIIGFVSPAWSTARLRRALAIKLSLASDQLLTLLAQFHKETPKPKAKSVVSRDAQRAATKAMYVCPRLSGL